MKQQASTIHCCKREQTGLSRLLAQTVAVAYDRMHKAGLLLGTETVNGTNILFHCLYDNQVLFVAKLSCATTQGCGSDRP